MATFTIQQSGSFLPKAGIPADHGNGVVPAVHCHGEVERSDDSNQAYGIPLLDERVARSWGQGRRATCWSTLIECLCSSSEQSLKSFISEQKCSRPRGGVPDVLGSLHSCGATDTLIRKQQKLLLPHYPITCEGVRDASVHHRSSGSGQVSVPSGRQGHFTEQMRDVPTVTAATRAEHDQNTGVRTLRALPVPDTALS